jgi:transposase
MNLYLTGKSAKEIQLVTNIPADTIQDWIGKYNWKQKEKEIQQRLEEQSVDTIVQYKEQFMEMLEVTIKDLQSKIELSKNPTSDKLYHVLLEYQKLALSLKGIQFDQKQVSVEHKGNVTVKLEDLV